MMMGHTWQQVTAALLWVNLRWVGGEQESLGSSQMVVTVPNGVLALKRGKVAIISGFHMTAITILAPSMDKDIIFKLNDAQNSLHTAVKTHRLEASDADSFIKRLNFLKNAIMWSPLTSHRKRRSLIPVISDISHHLFGFARDKDVKRVKKLIQQNRNQNRKFIVQINDMASSITHSFERIHQNSERIQTLTKLMSNMSETINILIDVTQIQDQDIRKLYYFNRVSSVMSSFEAIATRYRFELIRFYTRRNMAQLSRLTQDLLPRDYLIKIKQSLPLGFHLVGDSAGYRFEWIYHNVRTFPIFSVYGEITYVCYLPLSNKKIFEMYEFLPFKIPTSHLHYYLKMNVEAKTIAMDTQTGWFCRPRSCQGVMPQLCSCNLRIKEQLLPCITSLIHKKPHPNCQVEISYDNDTNSKLAEVDEHSAIMSTYGNTISINCEGQITKKLYLKRGVYLLHPRPECLLTGDSWMFKNVARFAQNFTIHERILETVDLGMPELLGQKLMIDHIQKLDMPGQPLSKLVPLQQLPLPESAIEQVNNTQSLWIILSMAMIATIVVYLMLQYLQLKFGIIKKLFAFIGQHFCKARKVKVQDAEPENQVSTVKRSNSQVVAEYIANEQRD